MLIYSYNLPTQNEEFTSVWMRFILNQPAFALMVTFCCKIRLKLTVAEVTKCMNSYLPLFYLDVIIYPCPNPDA